MRLILTIRRLLLTFPDARTICRGLEPMTMVNTQRLTDSRYSGMHSRLMIVMVMLSILIVASATGCINVRDYNDHPPRYAFNIEFSSIHSYRVNDSLFWEINGIINDMRSKPGSNWSNHRVYLYTGYPSQEVNFTFKPRPTNPTNDFSFYYIERTGDPNGPDEGDIIGALGLTRMHQKAYVAIFDPDWGDHIVAQAHITTWNETFSLTLSKGPTLMPRPARAPNVTITVESIAPDWEKIRWSDVVCKIFYTYLILPFPTDNSQNLTKKVLYREVGTPNGLIDPGERIEIVGMPEEWFGEQLIIKTGQVEIGQRALPDFFS